MPALVALSASDVALMVELSSTLAVTALVFLAVVTDAPMAAMPTDAPSVCARCDEVSLATTLTTGAWPLVPETDPPISAVTTLLTEPTATAALAPK